MENTMTTTTTTEQWEPATRMLRERPVTDPLVFAGDDQYGLNGTSQRAAVIALINGGKSSDELMPPYRRFLSDAEAHRIRDLAEECGYKTQQLASLFGVPDYVIQGILSGRTYREVA